MAEQAGAGALVIRSLFEEQIQFDALRMEESLSVGAESQPEGAHLFPQHQTRRSQGALDVGGEGAQGRDIPAARQPERRHPGCLGRVRRAAGGDGRQRAGTQCVLGGGRHAPRRDGHRDRNCTRSLQAVRQQIKIPLAVKLSPFYTSVANVAAELDKSGAAGLVLFNRFLQPDIDPATETPTSEMVLEHARGAQAAAALDRPALRPHQGRDRLEHRRPLRSWTRPRRCWPARPSCRQPRP